MSRAGRSLLGVALAGLLAFVAAIPSAAHAQDAIAPRGAEPHWLPAEEWVNLQWLPFDEARLYRLLGRTRGDVFRWVRIDARHTIAQLGNRRGYSASRLAAALVAPRRGSVSARTLRLIRRHTRLVITQGHLGQHFLFHNLHQTSIPEHAGHIFGVPRRIVWVRLRRAELSPLQIGELYGRSRTSMQRRAAADLRAAAARGVRRGQLSGRQRGVMLERQLRQLPRWLAQNRYNGPSGGRNRPDLPPADVAKHPTLSRDGAVAVWDAYRTSIPEAERRGEIHVVGAHLAAKGHRFAVSPPVRAGSERPRSAYNSVVSADGRYAAFESAESTFPLAKRVGNMSVLVRDLRTGAVERVSHASRPPGAPTRTAFNPTLSADGRLVAYEAVDNGVGAGLFAYDRALGSEKRIAEHSGAGAAFLPRLSGDGSAVAYTAATSAYGGRTLVFVCSLADGSTALAARAGEVADSDAYEPALSADGSVVAFTTRARNLGGGTGNRSRVYVRDLRTGRTDLVSGGAPGQASQPAVSGDGRYVAFAARIGRFRGTLATLRSRIYVHDRVTGRTVLASRADGPRGRPADGYASEPALSGDGRLVAFTSTGGRLSRAKAAGLAGVFVRDLAAGTTRLLSRHALRRARGGGQNGGRHRH